MNRVIVLFLLPLLASIVSVAQSEAAQSLPNILASCDDMTTGRPYCSVWEFNGTKSGIPLSTVQPALTIDRFDNSGVVIRFAVGPTLSYVYSGRLEGDRIFGTVNLAGPPGMPPRKGTWMAVIMPLPPGTLHAKAPPGMPEMINLCQTNKTNPAGSQECFNWIVRMVDFSVGGGGTLLFVRRFDAHDVELIGIEMMAGLVTSYTGKRTGSHIEGAVSWTPLSGKTWSGHWAGDILINPSGSPSASSMPPNLPPGTTSAATKFVSTAPPVLNICTTINGRTGQDCFTLVKMKSGGEWKYIDLQTTYPRTQPFPELDALKFDSSGVVLSTFKSEEGIAANFSGQIAGNHVQGTYTYTDPRSTKSGTWTAHFAGPKTGDPAKGQSLYVLNKEKLAIINTANHAVKTFPLGNWTQGDIASLHPGCFAVAPDGSKAYIAHRAIYSLDAATGSLIRLYASAVSPTSLGFDSVGVSQDGKILYATSYAVNVESRLVMPSLAILNAATGALMDTIPLPGYPLPVPGVHSNAPVQILPIGSKVYAGSSVIDLSSRKISPLSPGDQGNGVVGGPDGHAAFMAGRLINHFTDAPGQPYTFGPVVMIMPSWQKAYVPLQNVGRAGLQVLDPAEPLRSGKEGKLLKLIPGIHPPVNMVLSPDGKLLYAINVGKGEFGDMTGQVLVIDTTTDELVDIISVPQQPLLLGIQSPPPQPR